MNSIWKFCKWLYSKLIKKSKPLTEDIKKWALEKTERPRYWSRVRFNRLNADDVMHLSKRQSDKEKLTKLEYKSLERFKMKSPEDYNKYALYGQLIIRRPVEATIDLDNAKAFEELQKTMPQPIMAKPITYVPPDFSHIKPK